MSSKAISVKNLVKTYKKARTNAVDNVSFEVNEGEFFAFLGPNGAGKTTTISIITTTLSRSAGKVEVLGKDVETAAPQIRKEIGIIFQRPSLDLNLTAEENIRLHASLYGLYTFRPRFSWMPQAYKDQVINLAELLGIRDAISQKVETFSGGMKRKLEIVRSLMHDPKILFLDEPTTGLDPESRQNLWNYLQKVRQEHGTTIFLTTHYLDEAETTDRVVVINHGKIVADGTPAELKKQMLDEYLIVETKDKARLEAELTKQQIKFSKAGKRYKIEELEKTSVQELMQQIKTKLYNVEIHRPSLEQAYLKLIQTDENNNA